MRSPRRDAGIILRYVTPGQTKLYQRIVRAGIKTETNPLKNGSRRRILILYLLLRITNSNFNNKK